MDFSIDLETCYRLGKQKQNKAWPIKMTFYDQSKRDKVLYSSKKLKNSDSTKHIFLNSDLTPLQQREFQRLRTLRIEEMKKPENHGKKIYIHKGALMIDGRKLESLTQNFQ